MIVYLEDQEEEIDLNREKSCEDVSSVVNIHKDFVSRIVLDHGWGAKTIRNQRFLKVV